MMSPEPPVERSPIGESPKWIALHAFVAVGSFPVFVRLVSFATQNWYRLVQAGYTLFILAILINLARIYACRGHGMTKVETSYLRFALYVISISGAMGMWHLSIPAGVAFLVWTSVVRRRQRRLSRNA